MEMVQSIKLGFHNQAIERKASLNSPGRWDSGILSERDSELLLSDTCVMYIVGCYCVFMLPMCTVVPITHHKHMHFLFYSEDMLWGKV